MDKTGANPYTPRPSLGMRWGERNLGSLQTWGLRRREARPGLRVPPPPGLQVLSKLVTQPSAARLFRRDNDRAARWGQRSVAARPPPLARPGENKAIRTRDPDPKPWPGQSERPPWSPLKRGTGDPRRIPNPGSDPHLGSRAPKDRTSVPGWSRGWGRCCKDEAGKPRSPDLQPRICSKPSPHSPRPDPPPGGLSGLCLH